MKSESSPMVKSALKGRGHAPVSESGYWNLIRKTILLNLGIIFSALAIAATLDGSGAVLIIAVLVPMVSIILWSATFAISAFVSLCRIYWSQGLSVTRQPSRSSAGGGGVSDHWLDDPT